MDVINRGSCLSAAEASKSTGAWSPGGLLEETELLGVLVGKWNHFGYATPAEGQAGIPPFGERNADAIRGGHGAIEVIDRLLRQLHVVREQLIGELRQDSDIRSRRVDAMIAEGTRRRAAAATEAWHR